MPKLTSLAKEYTLGKNERLKSRKLIDTLFKEGKSLVQQPFRVYYVFDQLKVGELQFGIGVSTRNFKKAVDRNRVKRLAREAWRLHKSALKLHLQQQKTQLAVFIIYTGKELPEFADVVDKIKLVIQRLRAIAEKKT